jgi:transposase
MAYSLDLRQRVVEVAQKEGKSKAARRFMVSRDAVEDWVKRAEAGKLEHDTSPGRPRRIGREVEQQLQTQVEGQNDASLEEHCQQWKGRGQAKVSVSTMYRSLKRLKLSLKKDQSSQ